MSALDRPEVQAVLARLHAQARAQEPRWRLGLGLGLRRRLAARRQDAVPDAAAVAERTRALCLSVSPEQGRLLYLLARMLGARRVVEYGTSYGVSAVYLAAAVQDVGEAGSLIGTELVAEKRAAAEASLRAAGLSGVAEIRGGDALETLRDVAGPLDLIFLDGHKPEYLPVLQLLAPRLRVGGAVVADNLLTFPEALRPYRRWIGTNRSFVTVLLPLGGGMLLSVKTAP